MFSDRSALTRASHALAAKLADRHARGLPVLDLTHGDPRSANVPYDGRIENAHIDPAIFRDDAHPLGLSTARAAIAEQLDRAGITIDRSQVAIARDARELLASLITLLCDPGDEILVPSPSHRLLASIASFSGVAVSSYPLRYDGRWRPDPAEIWEAINDRTRAIVIVSPSCPTGAYLSRDDAHAIAALGLPLIADETSARYPLDPPEDRVRAASLHETLVLAIDGPSAHSQLALRWATVTGPGADEAIARLEAIAEDAGSLGRWPQVALPTLLASARADDAILARTRTNLATLRELGKTLEAPRVEGGWHAPIRLPSIHGDETWALALLDRGVLVQPGARYDWDDGPWIVLSLLTPEADFRQGLEIVLDTVTEAN
jgi:alanine-synthesizing transaminase